MNKENIVKYCKRIQRQIDEDKSHMRREYIKQSLEAKLKRWDKFFKYLLFPRPTSRDAVIDYMCKNYPFSEQAAIKYMFYDVERAIQDTLLLCENDVEIDANIVVPIFWYTNKI